MTETFLDGRVVLHPGDCREVLRALPDNSIDSVVTDPPYALVSIVKRFGGNNAAACKVPEGGTGAYARASAGFMGKQWDTGETAFAAEFWAEVLRVLKPGGHLAAFGGTRSSHRMVCAIEDAGFEIRDSLSWLYGTGFPKSHDVSKGIDKAAGAVREVISEGKAVKRMIPGADQNEAGWIKDDGREFVPTVTRAATPEGEQWEGWGTALKPAIEPICLARKPLSEPTVAANVLRWGTGAINVGACRVSLNGEDNPSVARRNGAINHLSDRPARETEADGKLVSRQSPEAYRLERAGEKLGRWPANVLLSWPEDEYALRRDITREQRQELFRWLHENP